MSRQLCHKKTVGGSKHVMSYMKHLTNAEVGMWNAEGWSRCALSFFKIDRIHHFDIRHSLFDIRFFKVSFLIKLTAYSAGGLAEP